MFLSSAVLANLFSRFQKGFFVVVVFLKRQRCSQETVQLGSVDSMMSLALVGCSSSLVVCDVVAIFLKGLWVMNAEETSACGSSSVMTQSAVAETDDSPVVLQLNLAVALNGRINLLRCQHCLH